jgi:hypothetical protein
MASITGTVVQGGSSPNTYTYVITDMAGSIQTITAVARIVTINQTTGTGMLRDGQALLNTLLQLLSTGKKPMVNPGSNSFFDYN